MKIPILIRLPTLITVLFPFFFFLFYNPQKITPRAFNLFCAVLCLQISVNLFDDWYDLRNQSYETLSKRKQLLWRFRERSPFAFVLKLPFILTLALFSMGVIAFYLPSLSLKIFYMCVIPILIGGYAFLPQRRKWIGLGETLVFLAYGILMPYGLRQVFQIPFVGLGWSLEAVCGFFALTLLWANHTEDYGHKGLEHFYLKPIPFHISQKILSLFLFLYKISLIGAIYHLSMIPRVVGFIPYTYFLFLIIGLTFLIDALKMFHIFKHLSDQSLRLHMITSGLRDLIVTWILIYRSRVL